MRSPSPPEGASDPGLGGVRLVTAVVEKLADSSFPEMLVAVSAGTSPEVSENAWEEERERPELPVRDAATVAEADTASTEL